MPVWRAVLLQLLTSFGKYSTTGSHWLAWGNISPFSATAQDVSSLGLVVVVLVGLVHSPFPRRCCVLARPIHKSIAVVSFIKYISRVASAVGLYILARPGVIIVIKIYVNRAPNIAPNPPPPPTPLFSQHIGSRTVVLARPSAKSFLCLPIFMSRPRFRPTTPPPSPLLHINRPFRWRGGQLKSLAIFCHLLLLSLLLLLLRLLANDTCRLINGEFQPPHFATHTYMTPIHLSTNCVCVDTLGEMAMNGKVNGNFEII